MMKKFIPQCGPHFLHHMFAKVEKSEKVLSLNQWEEIIMIWRGKVGKWLHKEYFPPPAWGKLSLIENK